MARHLGWALAMCVLLGSPGRADASKCDAAQADQQRGQQQDKKPDEHRRPWLWWKDEAAKAELKLTADQVAQIERVFNETMAKAKPLRDEVTKLEEALNQTMRANTAEISVVSQQVDTVESKRAELNKMRVLMLYRMHRVLSPDQNTRFLAMVDRRDAARKKDPNGAGRRK
jgi:Spy/CpxP family protein refolding chaperone